MKRSCVLSSLFRWIVTDTFVSNISYVFSTISLFLLNRKKKRNHFIRIITIGALNHPMSAPLKLLLDLDAVKILAQFNTLLVGVSRSTIFARRYTCNGTSESIPRLIEKELRIQYRGQTSKVHTSTWCSAYWFYARGIGLTLDLFQNSGSFYD